MPLGYNSPNSYPKHFSFGLNLAFVMRKKESLGAGDSSSFTYSGRWCIDAGADVAFK
jgi:hypothetical protein